MNYFLGLNPNFGILTEKKYFVIFYRLIAINKTKNLKYKESKRELLRHKGIFFLYYILF